MAEYLYASGVTANTIDKFLTSDMSLVASSPSYGAVVYAIVVDEAYVYAGGETIQTVRKYLKSDMSYITQSPNYGGDILGLAVDGDYIYVVGLTTARVRRYLKSDLSYVDQSPADGGLFMQCVAVDDTHVYATRVVIHKYLKSDLSWVVDSDAPGGGVVGLVVDDTHIYAGFDSIEKVRKYLKSDMSFVQESTAWRNPATLSQDDDYVYSGAGSGIAATACVRRYEKNNLGVAANFPAYGGYVYAVANDSDYVYAGGATTQRVRKYLKSDLSYVAQTADIGLIYAIATEVGPPVTEVRTAFMAGKMMAAGLI